MTFENVTEKARARPALQESESRFRGAFHASSLGMALTSLDATFVQVNDRFAEMLVGTAMARIELKRLLVMSDRRPHLVQPPIGIANVVLDVGVARIA